MQSTNFTIIGLPRSGTTLLCNLFNSMSNCVCLSEPLWEFILKKTNRGVGSIDSLGKLGDYPQISGYDEVLPTIKKLFSESNLELLGIKETFRSWEPQCVHTVLTNFGSDINIFILRNPLANFSGWKKSNWGNQYSDIRYFAESYMKLLDLVTVSSQRTPTLVIKYEKLTENGVDYLREKCKNLLDVPKNLNLIKNQPGLGDEKAKESTKIESARMNYENLSQNEIEICNKLLTYYKSI